MCLQWEYVYPNYDAYNRLKGVVRAVFNLTDITQRALPLQGYSNIDYKLSHVGLATLRFRRVLLIYQQFNIPAIFDFESVGS